MTPGRTVNAAGEHPRASNQTISFLFVYGSLMSSRRGPLGAAQRRCLRWNGRFAGRAVIPGILIDLGGYPGAVRGTRMSQLIHGELWRMTDSRYVLAILDAYEGIDEAAPEYVREQVNVMLIGGRGPGPRVTAWYYRAIGVEQGVDGAA